MTAAKKLTVDDLFALGENTREELIHGEILPKAFSGAEHQNLECALLAWAHRRFHRNAGGRWPGGWWIFSEIHTVYDTHEVFSHDIAGWRRDRLPAPSGWIRVRPDWVCEVLSPSHEKRDLVDKLGVLHTAGVPDYWVIDHDEKILFMYQHRPEGYVMHTVSSGATIHARPFEAAPLRTAVLFGDEDDED
ncbi:MAG: Uma2 family endonuclease [Polyangiales bacterium]